MKTKNRTRQMVVCNKAYRRKYDDIVLYPIIHLRGKWLLQAGFRAGQIVNVQCEQGRLIIFLLGLRRD